MNQRQLKRARLLIDIVNRKRTERQNILLANSCINVTACGTKGCVWGDYVIAQGAFKHRQFVEDQLSGIQTFGTFADYIFRPTLATLSWDLDRNSEGSIHKYFGFYFNQHKVFGTVSNGDWEERYIHLVEHLESFGKVRYDPANIVFTES